MKTLGLVRRGRLVRLARGGRRVAAWIGHEWAVVGTSPRSARRPRHRPRGSSTDERS